MGRPSRHFEPGLISHVISRGNGGKEIFLVDQDWIRFLDILKRAKDRCGFRLFTYSLMPNHFHLLVQAGQVPLSTVVQRVLTSYACYFNRRSGSKGHLFQSRYKALPCQSARYLFELIHYISRNPVKAGLCSNPDEWEWSGHQEIIESARRGLVDRDLVLGLFEGSLLTYRDLVSAASLPATPTIRADMEPITLREQEEVPGEGQIERWALELCAEAQIAAEELRDRRRRERQISLVRKRLVRRCCDAGIGLAQTARFLGISRSAACRAAQTSQQVNV